MKTQPTAHARLKTALRALVLDHPYFGHLALSLPLKRETRGRTSTLATDGQCFYYDEAFVLEYPPEGLVTVLAHEVLHPALFHHTRRGDRERERWNDAGDFAINLLLQDAGFQIPSDWLIDPRYRGMTTEQIFDALKLEQSDSGNPGGDLGGEGAGPDSAESPPNESSSDPPPAGEVNPAPSHSLPGEVWDSPEPAQQEAEWQVLLRQAASVAAMMGKLPVGIAAAVEEAAQPRVDWRSILRRFVQQFASADYSWRRPNRRCVASGVYIPALQAESMPAIVVVADTSGSTRNVLDTFMAELRSIQEECQPEETIVIMADAKVHRVDRFARDEPVECHFVGMGGTDFRPAFEYLAAEQIDPACLIYLTDGEGAYPETPSEFPTLWAITSPGTLAPWGETVTIDPDAQ